MYSPQIQSVTQLFRVVKQDLVCKCSIFPGLSLIDHPALYVWLRAGGDTKEREKNSVGVSSSSVASRTTAARAAVDIGASERSIERYISWTDEGVDLFVCEADKVSLHAHVFPVRQVLIRPSDMCVFWR